MTQTLTAKIKALHAACPLLTAPQIAGELGTTPANVRAIKCKHKLDIPQSKTTRWLGKDERAEYLGK